MKSVDYSTEWRVNSHVAIPRALNLGGPHRLDARPFALAIYPGRARGDRPATGLAALLVNHPVRGIAYRDDHHGRHAGGDSSLLFSPWLADAPAVAVKHEPVENLDNAPPPQPMDDPMPMAAMPLPSAVEPVEKLQTEPAPCRATPIGPASIGLASAWSMVKSRVQPWLPEIVLVWFAGVLVVAMRFLLSWHTVRRLRRVGVSPVGGSVQGVLERTAEKLRLARAVGVLQSALVRTPVVLGWFRPLILLPACVVTGLSPDQLESILAHELAHIRRHDYLVNLLQTLVETLFFYHPAVWWLSRQIRNERENCCDDVAMGIAASRADYGRALLAIEELRAASPSLSLAASGGSLLARIRRIAGCEPTPRIIGGSSILGVILVSLAIAVAATWGASPAAEKQGANDSSEKTVDAKPADDASLASDRTATKEGKEKTKGVTWKTTFFDHATSKDGKRTWLKTETRQKAFKAPGLYRETFLDEKGQVWEVEITDAVHKKQLNLSPKTKEANLKEIATDWDPNGPFEWAKKELEDPNLQWVHTRKTAAGEANIFRLARRDQANGRDWSTDFWIDKKTKQLVEIHSPGADIYDPEKDPARNTPPEKQWSLTIPGHVEHDIVFDADLDDSLFRLEPPEGYTVKVQRRGQVTEKEMIDFLGIMADFNDKTFPDQPFISNDRVNKAWNKPRKDRTAAEQKLVEMTDYYTAKFQRNPVSLFIEDHAVENSLRYLGKGVKLGDKGRIVCWYKLKGANTYRAVYGDLSVKDVAPEDLPLPVRNGRIDKPTAEVSPANDQPATKEGSQPDSKPAPAQGLTAEPNTDQAKAIADIKQLGGTVTLDEKSPGKPVISVDLHGTKVTDAGLENLQDLPQLQSLVLFNTQITDAGLAHLKGLTKLRGLSLDTTKVTDAGLIHLKGLTQLQSLGLTHTKVTDAGLVHLKGLAQLRWLGLTQTQVSDAGLAHLKGLTQLQRLELGDTQVTDTGLTHLKGLSQLQSLYLNKTKITDAGLVHLKGLIQLHELDLDSTQVTDSGLSHLNGLLQLQSLNLTRTQVTDKGLKHLQGMVQLTSLGPGGTEFNDAGLEQIKGLSGLRTLDLTGTKITDAGLIHLEGLTQLKRLLLRETQVSNAGLEHLQGLTGLRDLVLFNTKVTDAGLVYLKGLVQLKTLYLGGTQVTDAGLEHLKGLTQLYLLSLDGTKVTDAGVEKLQQALPTCIIYHKTTESAAASPAPAVPKANDQPGMPPAATSAKDLGAAETKANGSSDASAASDSDDRHLSGFVVDENTRPVEGVKKLQQALPSCEIISRRKTAKSAPASPAPAVPKANDPSGKTSAAEPTDGADGPSSQNANSTKDELPNKTSTEKPGAAASSAQPTTPKADPRQLEIAKRQLEGWKNARDSLTSGIFRAHGRWFDFSLKEDPKCDGPCEYYCAFDYRKGLFRCDHKIPIVFRVRDAKTGQEVRTIQVEVGKYIATPVRSFEWSPDDSPTIYARGPNHKSDPADQIAPFDVRLLGVGSVGDFTGYTTYKEMLPILVKWPVVGASKAGEGVWQVRWQSRGFETTVWFKDEAGYLPLRMERRYLWYHGVSNPQERGETTWTQVSGVWIPKTAVLEQSLMTGRHIKIELAFDWESVNEPVPQSLFEAGSLLPPRVMANVVTTEQGRPVILDRLPGGLPPAKWGGPSNTSPTKER